MTNQHLTDQELAQLLKAKAAGFTLSTGEKQVMKCNLMEKIAGADVTKSAPKRYNPWIYKISFRGVVMPFLPILFAILLAGGVGTAALADNASPGDPLYAVDQWMEQVQQRWTNRAETKANLYARFADERLQELSELRNTDPSKLAERAREMWEKHHQEAVERVTKSIEQVTAVQNQFKEKLAAATDSEQKAVFQKIIDHLTEVQQRREERLTEVEDRTFPGLESLGQLRAQIQEMRQENQQEMQQVRERVREEFQGLRLGNGLGQGANSQTPGTSTSDVSSSDTSDSTLAGGTSGNDTPTNADTGNGAQSGNPSAGSDAGNSAR
ncbi:hypothetical protein JXA59_01460 [Patescibacteria group bacterium]|nr:hypothetical protein [Patescibacteria group bacterium]